MTKEAVKARSRVEDWILLSNSPPKRYLQVCVSWVRVPNPHFWQYVSKYEDHTHHYSSLPPSITHILHYNRRQQIRSHSLYYFSIFCHPSCHPAWVELRCDLQFWSLKSARAHFPPIFRHHCLQCILILDICHPSCHPALAEPWCDLVSEKWMHTFFPHFQTSLRWVEH